MANGDDILNGPGGAPNAQGPTDQNDDFTNKSTIVGPGVKATDTFDPSSVSFTNQVLNPASSGFLSNVTLQPIAPSQAQTAAGFATNAQYGVNGDIPSGTTVTVAYDPTPATPGSDIRTALYTYNGSTFALISSTTGGTADGTATHINVGNLPAGQSVSYNVAVDLPGTVNPVKEFSIPIVAFPDDDPVGSAGFTGETTNNVTINRLYTGFMKLTKEAQVLHANDLVKQAWTSDQAVLTGVQMVPGDKIEYRISYENISRPATGTGNVTLSAYEFKVIEAGDVSPNNWATPTIHQRNTIAKPGTTVGYFTNSGDASPATTADPTSGTQVKKYENTVGQVDPGQSGQFQFRRQLK